MERPNCRKCGKGKGSKDILLGNNSRGYRYWLCKKCGKQFKFTEEEEEAFRKGEYKRKKGGLPKGYKQSKKQRNNISKGLKNNPKVIAGHIGNKNALGHIVSLEARRKMNRAKLGKKKGPRSKKTKEKLKKAKLGTHQSQDTIIKIRLAKLGRGKVCVHGIAHVRCDKCQKARKRAYYYLKKGIILAVVKWKERLERQFQELEGWIREGPPIVKNGKLIN